VIVGPAGSAAPAAPAAGFFLKKLNIDSGLVSAAESAKRASLYSRAQAL